MTNINNSKRIFSSAISLGVLTLMVMVLSLPTLASAETAGYVNPYNSNPPEPMIIYEQEIIRVPVKTAAQTYTNNPKYNTQTASNTTNTSTQTTATTSNTTDRYGKLAASAVYGDNTFAPSGFVQWIMIAVLILVIIILARRIFGATDRYHKSPMKHA